MRVVTTLEIGSTIMRANAFPLEGGRSRHIGQGFVLTSVARGDVKIGVNAVIDEMRKTSGIEIGKTQVFVNSSAAGGLKMSVHGLTQGMTTHAAWEAVLGAGAIVGLTMVGAIDSWDVEDLVETNPSTVLLVGGIDYGEKRIVVDNTRMIAESGLRALAIYAGNITVRYRIQDVFARNDVELTYADNVFPDVDVLQIEPVRKLIHEVFNQHIVKAPGMARLTELFGFEILSTPGAVPLAIEILADVLGDALVIDVGGATTDIHSITDGSTEWTSHSIGPEPRAKHTVEGDLGVFVNARQVAAMSGETGDEERLEYLRAIPSDEKEEDVTHWLVARAAEVRIRRYVGSASDLSTPTGKKQTIHGKDLTAIRWIIGTGGMLTRIPGGDEILGWIRLGTGARLLPPPEARILIDRDYRFFALGTLAQVYHEEVTATLRDWVADEVGELPEPIEDETPEG